MYDFTGDIRGHASHIEAMFKKLDSQWNVAPLRPSAHSLRVWPHGGL